jgi:excisionase family DNA binding protein
MERLLTKKEVGERLGVSTRTVDRLRSIGKLPAVKFGGVVRFRPADVDRLVNRQTKGR